MSSIKRTIQRITIAEQKIEKIRKSCNNNVLVYGDEEFGRGAKAVSMTILKILEGEK